MTAGISCRSSLQDNFVIAIDIIKDINQGGTTILLVEQNASMALQIANRAYVMETGSIVLSGTGEELSNSDDIKKVYLGG